MSSLIFVIEVTFYGGNTIFYEENWFTAFIPGVSVIAIDAPAQIS
jgi:hypothetical protein